MKKLSWLMLILLAIPGAAEEKGKDFYWQAAFYQDWMGFKSGNDELFSRLSTRLNLTLWRQAWKRLDNIPGCAEPFRFG